MAGFIDERADELVRALESGVNGARYRVTRRSPVELGRCEVEFELRPVGSKRKSKEPISHYLVVLDTDMSGDTGVRYMLREHSFASRLGLERDVFSTLDGLVERLVSELSESQRVAAQKLVREREARVKARACPKCGGSERVMGFPWSRCSKCGHVFVGKGLPIDGP